MSLPKLLFFTYADKKYDFFAIPYAFFALINNPDSVVEFALEDYDLFNKNNNDAIERLNKMFPDRVLFRQSLVIQEQKIIPNTVRFVEEAQLKAEYLYIGDIDLLVLENVLNRHLNLINKYGLPFSNIVRKNSDIKKLSGLHFVRYQDYYPLPKLDDIDLSITNDEHVLYQIMSRRGLMVPEEFNIRPLCGIHMSLSRDPLARSTGPTNSAYSNNFAMGWDGTPSDYQRFLQLIRSDEYANLFPFFDIQFKLLVVMAESISLKKYRNLHKLASAYLLDRSMIIPDSKWSKKQFITERDACIKDKKFEEAIALGCKSLIIWPNEIDFWVKQIWLYKAVGDDKRFISGFEYILESENGDEIVEKSSYLLEHYNKIKSLLV